jgi:hypothetical protein
VIGAVVAAIAMLDDFGCALQGAHLVNAEHHTPVPHDLKLEVLVGVDAMCVDDKSLRHEALR